MKSGGFENSTLAFMAAETTISPKVNLREKIKIEFYKTYDAMTGIRIAATLGGFFSMMILLVLYKNYCKPSKTLSEEQLNAAVTAAAEEEDRALQAALEATSFYTALEKRRESLRNTNPVLLSPRFSSVGGGYSPFTPPVKVLQQRGKSLPGSVLLHFGSNSGPTPTPKSGGSESLSKGEDFDFHGQGLDYFACRNYLNVLPSRRVSSVTCSSADSAYLEKRCSVLELGLPSPSRTVRHSKEKLRERKDYYYPIDIQVIQPTPEMSPTASERNLNEEQSGCNLQVPGFHDQMHRLSVTSIDIGLAPLASISSLGSFCSHSAPIPSKSSNNPENQICPSADDSLGSDSVFMDIEDEEFTTDSEFEYDGFDDDYSFCETKERPPSRTEMRPPQFASFDSFDASITQDSVAETPDTPKTSDDRQTFPGEFKRHPSLHDPNRTPKKLVKTYSEPRNTRSRRLPAWAEKGRTGLIPRRQLSSPSAKRKNEVPQQPGKRPGDDEDDPTKFLLPPSKSSTDSVTLVPIGHDSPKIQGIDTELPLKVGSPKVGPKNAQEKRSRLQKQKNFVEEVVEGEANKTEGPTQHLNNTKDTAED